MEDTEHVVRVGQFVLVQYSMRIQPQSVALLASTGLKARGGVGWELFVHALSLKLLSENSKRTEKARQGTVHI